MDLVKRLFPYRSCTKTITGSDSRPCLEYYINRCVAPCTGYASREDYAQVIDQVIMFMEGDTDAVTQDLEENMTQAAESLEFERAAVLRDRIKAVERVAEERRIKVDSGPERRQKSPLASGHGRHCPGPGFRRGLGGGVLHPQGQAHRARALLHGRARRTTRPAWSSASSSSSSTARP